MERLNRIRNGVKIDGNDTTIDSVDVEIIVADDQDNALICRGLTVPSADAGYAKGAIFIKTDAGDGVKSLYENQGTTSSCNFNLIGDISTAEIANNAITVAKISNSLLKYTDVTLTAQQIKALRATPITLIPATEAGAGYAIVPIAVVLNLNAGTEVLSETVDNLAIKCSTTEIFDIETTGFIDQLTDQNRYQEKAEAVMTPVANTAIVLTNKGDGEFGGNATNDATLTVRTFYRVIPVL